jgi:hypothetical protein
VLGPFTPLPYDYYETAGRVRVTQPIGGLLGPGGKRLFEDSGLATDGGPGVKASGSGQIKNPSGNAIPVGASGRVSGSAASGAIGRAIPKLLKQVSGPLGVGMVLYDLAKELDFDLSKDDSGGLAVSKNDPTVCTVDPCYSYSMSTPNVSASDREGVCSAWTSGWGALNPGYFAVMTGTTTTGGGAGAGECIYSKGYTSNGEIFGTGYTTSISKSTVPASPSVAIQSTSQEFLDAVAAKSGWPSTSALSRALSDSVAATGEQLSITDTPSVTGPSSSPGTTTTTNNTTNNTTTTSTTNYQHTYAGDTINTTTTTTNVTINNTTGDVIDNSTTTTQSAPPAEPFETCGLPGKPACKIDETGTPKYADVEETLKLDKTTLDEASKAQRDTIQGNSDKGMFSSWSSLFTLPALRACEPVELPSYSGFVLGSYDVCPGAEWLRGLMAWVWAIAGFAFVFKTVEGVI